MPRVPIEVGQTGTNVTLTPFRGVKGAYVPIPTAEPCGVCQNCCNSGDGITLKCSNPRDWTKGQGKIVPTAWRARVRVRMPDGSLKLVERMDRNGDRDNGKSKASKSEATTRVLTAARELAAEAAAPKVERNGSTVLEIAEGWCEKIRSDSRDESLDDAARLSPGTVNLYTGAIRRYLVGSDLAGMSMIDVDAQDITDLLDEVARRKGVQTARSLRAALSGVWKHAKKDRLVPTNLVREAELPDSGRKVAGRKMHDSDTGEVRTVRAERSHDRSLSDPELDALAAACEASADATVGDLIMAMVETGVRVGEACGWLWADVDLDEGTVSVAGTVTRVPGGGLVRSGTKTRMSERTIPLSARAIALLSARRGAEADPAAPVFPSAAGTYLDPSNVQKRIRSILDPIGLSWATPHTFRRTALTRLADRVPLRLVADLAGHADPAMTARVYLGRKGDSAALRDAMNAL